MADLRKYTGQVILEREFVTKEAAQAWMDRQEKNAGQFTHVEKHLWEPASPIGGKEVE